MSYSAQIDWYQWLRRHGAVWGGGNGRKIDNKERKCDTSLNNTLSSIFALFFFPSCKNSSKCSSVSPFCRHFINCHIHTYTEPREWGLRQNGASWVRRMWGMVNLYISRKFWLYTKWGITIYQSFSFSVCWVPYVLLPWMMVKVSPMWMPYTHPQPPENCSFQTNSCEMLLISLSPHTANIEWNFVHLHCPPQNSILVAMNQLEVYM